MLQEDAEAEGHLELLPDLQKINTAGKHLLGLISDILDLSKIEAGKMTINLEEFNLARLIYDTVATIQPLVEKNGNTLKITCPDNLGTIISDPTRVRQCLFNLLSNAAKFTSNGIITFEVGRSDRHSDECQADVLASILTAVSGYPSLVVFRVTDTGIGIPLEQIPNLFQPFTQVDPSATRKYGGTGLGLAITKRFCQIMGGDISVESEPGKGSVFTLWLPTIRASNAKVNPDIEVGESSI
jgi:signal transduction histidine kinase